MNTPSRVNVIVKPMQVALEILNQNDNYPPKELLDADLRFVLRDFEGVDFSYNSRDNRTVAVGFIHVPYVTMLSRVMQVFADLRNLGYEPIRLQG